MEIQLRKYRIEEESIIGRISELTDNLLSEHWEESSKNKHLMVLNPDVMKYEVLESSGMLFTLFAYVDDELVGYSCNIIQKHIHYSDLLCAYNDVLFVSKKYRDSPLGIRLIKATEKLAKEKGVHLMLWHAKDDTPLSKILPAMRCNLQELIFSKEL